jgi:predicted nuclease of predicted toxin-antitoxin system
VRLPLDEHLSRHLCSMLSQEFPGTAHLADFNLLKADDETVWQFAKTYGFTILSKDGDFQQRSFLHGHPPKVIWIQIGNRSTAEIAVFLRLMAADIAAFEADEQSSLLVLS